MSQQSRRELLAAVTSRYQTANGAEREHILDEFAASTGYHRKYAITFVTYWDYENTSICF